MKEEDADGRDVEKRALPLVAANSLYRVIYTIRV